MLVRKTSSKKKFPSGLSNVMPLDSSLTSIEWLPNMQIGENSSSASGKSAAPVQQQIQQALPVTTQLQLQHKLEAVEVEIPTSTVNENIHIKPPYSYVTLIRQAILSTKMHRMTLNEIYQWIVESYPYFRTAPPKWKNSIRHNLSLNKCFKRLQRSTNDPGKGSYWAVDESPDNINTNNQINARKRKYDEIQSSPHLYPSSPATLLQHPPGFCTNNNPMVCGDLSSIGGQSSSTDESESAVSLNANQPLIQWEDLNLDLTASFRRFREQVLDAPSTTWTSNVDPSVSTTNLNYWNHDLFPKGETNSFLESVKLASSGEINWNDIDVKPYCEFLDGFRTSSTFPQQDRDKLINITSSLTSFFDYTGITNLAQSKIANELNMSNRLPPVSNRTSTGSIDNSTTLPIEIDEEGAFDWDLLA